jgi:hypothetical protein
MSTGNARDQRPRNDLHGRTRKLMAALATGTLATGLAVALPVATGEVASAATTTPATPNASAVGRLTPRGCTGSPGVVSCDLYAKTGTTQVGGVGLPIWGFATDSTSAVTAPGPLLVVTRGDVVTITVHNGLSSNLSLALPGQHLVNGGGGDDMTGVGQGSTASYTFTASQAGTFAYEAGHTQDGARQVAMGLAGALVVLPPTSGTLDGTAGTAYDDDAPLVLSEIDPALNTSADPLSFDMRNFHPAYRLINGHTFPSAANTIATDQAHKVLVRYVNVGEQSHSMSVLGASQVELAQDGHPAKYTTTVTAESVEPGMTLDTLVTMPTATQTPGDPRVPTKVAVYEANGALDNNAAVTQDSPAQVAFGGMLVFLDTQAPVDISKDYTGPTAKNVKVDTPAADALHPVTVTATISDVANGGSTIKAAEYIIDDDDPNGPIAASAGTPMTLANDPVTAPAVTTTATGIIPASVLADANFAAGKHIVYVRGKDVVGNWGLVGSVVLNVPKTGPATTGGVATPALTNGTVSVDISATGNDSVAGGTITNAEFFLDTAGANGGGTSMIVNRSASVASVDATLPIATVAALSEGTHHVFVHVKDSLQLWGPVLDIPLTIDKTGPATLATAISPPATNGKTSDPSNPGYFKLTTEIKDAAPGNSTIVQAEAFLGSVKAVGTGLQLRPIDGKLDSSDETMYALIPLSQISTFKSDQNVSVYVHGKDAAGNWGSMSDTVASLILDRTPPALTGLTASLPSAGTPGIALTSAYTETNTLYGAETWTSTTTPAPGTATPAVIGSAANGKVTVYASASSAAAIYHLRVKDIAGNWSNVVATSSTVAFRSNLDNTGTNFGWNNVVGTTTGTTPSASIIAGAAHSNADEPTSTTGFQANIAQSPNGARTGFLVETIPTPGSGAYHARFQFQASTLTSGPNASNVVTVFDTRSGTGTNGGAEVFGVQFKGTGPTAQIRPVAGAAVGAWVTVGNTSHTIQVDWQNGATASLVLSIDATLTQTVPAGNVTTTIRAAQFGVSASLVPSTNNVASTLGKAWFDTFLSVGSS